MKTDNQTKQINRQKGGQKLNMFLSKKGREIQSAICKYFLIYEDDIKLVR